MAKIAKLKMPRKALSAHSRASRRQSSPSLNLDKSLTSLKPPSIPKPNIFAPHASGGVTKSKKKGGQVLKRKKKQRLEQGKERAEAATEKLQMKIEKAWGRREGKKGRNADWDELNEKIAGKRGKNKAATYAGEQKDDDGEDKEVDGVGTEAEMGGVSVFQREKNGMDGEDSADRGGGVDDEIL